MIISTSNHNPDFRVEVRFAERLPSGGQNVFLELGPEYNGVRVLLSSEQLREVQYIIDQAFTDFDRDAELGAALAHPIDQVPFA